MRADLLSSIAVLAAVLVGCGGDAGGTAGGGTCRSLAGTWEISAHSCNPSAIGSTLTFVQSNCTIDSIVPWTGWSGTMQPGGAGTWSGPAGGGATMVCQAATSGTTIQATCVPACEVTIVLQ